jgi:hypothetical protein
MLVASLKIFQNLFKISMALISVYDLPQIFLRFSSDFKRSAQYSLVGLSASIATLNIFWSAYGLKIFQKSS